MPEAAYAIIGVVVGALSTGAVQYLLERRRNLVEARAAARLVYDELLEAGDRAKQTLREIEEQGRTVFPLADIEPRDEMWVEHRGRLAAVLRGAEWSQLERVTRARMTLKRRLAERTREGQDVETDRLLSRELTLFRYSLEDDERWVRGLLRVGYDRGRVSRFLSAISGLTWVRRRLADDRAQKKRDKLDQLLKGPD
jgi:hypothetical protein